MTMVPCDEEVGAANTAAHDLCFVVDGTGSMTYFLRALAQSLPQVMPAETPLAMTATLQTGQDKCPTHGCHPMLMSAPPCSRPAARSKFFSETHSQNAPRTCCAYGMPTLSRPDA